MFSLRIRKTIAVFLLIVFIQSILTPALTYALTSGPTAPEYSSFEPVDTTDMVNVLTGDFVYNTPLIDIPGPSGSYPFSLSYHAGIQPNIEASWVGLGFSVNPGSINRLVNGYADDHQEAAVFNHVFWSGRSNDTWAAGISAGRSASVTAGLSFTQDSHYGFSVNPYVAGGALIPGTPIGITAASNGTAQLTSRTFDILNSIQSNQYNFSRRFGPLSLVSLDASISSKQIKAKLSVAGIAKNASQQGKISTSSTKWSVTIPTPWKFSINLGRNYVRQWIDETTLTRTNGTLYNPQRKLEYKALDKRSFDTYDLLSPFQSFEMDPEKVLGGSFPDYDEYNVSAQGLSGSIRPYHYYEHLYRQNRYDEEGDPTVRAVPLGATGKGKIGFRFVNDFSNRFLFEQEPLYAYDQYDFDLGNLTAGLDGEGYKNNKLAGSKHIEWYSNNEILNSAKPKSEGFLECSARGFVRSDQSLSQIGGYKITNESGVTYHFALPVYSFEEYSYSEKIVSRTKTYNEVTKPEKYAYTWLLTAITGPDYVDRNNNSKADEGDWGYWVEFGYNKWSSDYLWRNPATGFNIDLDNNFKNYAYGKKEVYYLDYARTATHIAVFAKSTRLDGKGVKSKEGGFGIGSAITQKLDQIYLLRFEDFQQLGGFNLLPDLKTHKKNLLKKSIKSVLFETDYSLCPNTLNSFDPALLSDPSVPVDLNHGKLTLKSLKFLGKGGADLLPPLSFNYEPINQVSTQVELRLDDSTDRYGFTLNDSKLETGDILRIDGSETSYAVIEDISSSGQHQLLFLKGYSPPQPGIVHITETKNPPYNKDMTDMWSMYKSDFNGTIEESKTIDRYTSWLSAKSVDVWSLRSITTSLGATINVDYEADYYDDVALAKLQGLRIKDAVKESATTLKLYFFDDDLKIEEYFVKDELANLLLLYAYGYRDLTYVNNPTNCHCADYGHAYHKDFNGNVRVRSINQSENSIVIESQALVGKLEASEIVVIDEEHVCSPHAGCSYNVRSDWPSFIVGGALYSQKKGKYGGNVRVKKISIISPGGTRSTNYTYYNGTTSYEPFSIASFEANPNYINYLQEINAETRAAEFSEASLMFRRLSLANYIHTISIAREIPSPAVLYSKVKVRGSSTLADGSEYFFPESNEFTFQTYDPDLFLYKFQNKGGIRFGGPPEKVAGLAYDRGSFGETSLYDLTSAVGNIKSVVTFNEDGSPVEEKRLAYLHDEFLDRSGQLEYGDYESRINSKYKGQGIIKEGYVDARLYRKIDGKFAYLGSSSKRKTYPSIQVKETITNYKTGITITNETEDFDFFSGEVTKSIQSDSYGNLFLTEKVPAYKQYPGMKSMVEGGKNMLTQVAAETTYKIKSDKSVQGVISSSVQTWSDQVNVLEQAGPQTGIWRKHASFVWEGSKPLKADGTYNHEHYNENPFNWTDPNNSRGWSIREQVTLYDTYSHTIEAKDMNGNFASLKLDPLQERIIATASNASYAEIAYSGAEYYSGNMLDEGGVDRGEGNPTASRSHSGKFSLLVGFSSKGFNYKLRSGAADLSKSYKASVWVYAPGESETQPELDKIQLYYSSGGVEKEVHPTVQKMKSKSWYLLTLDIPANLIDDIEIGCRNNSARGVYFDDFRVQPVNASMASFVYDNTSGELTFVLDNNNFYTKYEYDNAGRLVRTSKEMLNYDFGNGKESFREDQIISEVIYNYGKKN